MIRLENGVLRRKKIYVIYNGLNEKVFVCNLKKHSSLVLLDEYQGPSRSQRQSRSLRPM